jgi:hypothetical protein
VQNPTVFTLARSGCKALLFAGTLLARTQIFGLGVHGLCIVVWDVDMPQASIQGAGSSHASDISRERYEGLTSKHCLYQDHKNGLCAGCLTTTDLDPTPWVCKMDRRGSRKISLMQSL